MSNAKYPVRNNEENAVFSKTSEHNVISQILFLSIYKVIMDFVFRDNRIWNEQNSKSYEEKICFKAKSLHDSFMKKNPEVLFLQEVNEDLIKEFQKLMPEYTFRCNFFGSQPSAVVYHNSLFVKCQDFSETVTNDLDCLMKVDLMFVLVEDSFHNKYFLASFHGDSKGNSALPVLEALYSISNEQQTPIIIGIDANTSNKTLNSFLDGVSKLEGFQLNENEEYTVASCRHVFQAQAHKAVRYKDLSKKLIKERKDFIISSGVIKSCDQVGEGEFFPSSKHDSDHKGVYGEVLFSLKHYEFMAIPKALSISEPEEPSE